MLFRQDAISNNTDAVTIVSNLFETYLGKSYILPDSGVFFFHKVENRSSLWEIWIGFRVSKSDVIRVYKIGVASKDRMEIDDQIKLRTNFRGVELKTTTVVCMKI